MPKEAGKAFSSYLPSYKSWRLYHHLLHENANFCHTPQAFRHGGQATLEHCAFLLTLPNINICGHGTL